MSAFDPGLHFGSNSDEWYTAQPIYDELHAELGFTIDLAATHGNTKCPRYFTMEDDALSQRWSGRGWLNAPYSQIISFAEKTIQEVRAGNVELVAMLVPARTDSIWFRELFEYSDEVRFRSGRLKFGDSQGNAPFPSCIIILRSQRQRTWSVDGTVRYSMPKRHGSRPPWFLGKSSNNASVTSAFAGEEA